MRLDWDFWNVALVAKAWVFVFGWVQDDDGWFFACDVIKHAELEDKPSSKITEVKDSDGN